ncbi:MAG: twin-arginine translocase subunit TatC [Phycisphaerae bacterium]|nr:twin-arginine translocase subunit TatC [Phycisphaerae bacterium]
MTVADRPHSASNFRPPPLEDPAAFRMSIGEHLEELRWRLILSLIGLGVAVLVCMGLGERVIVWFCAPLIRGMMQHDLPPQLHYTGLSDLFMLYLKVTFICAACISGPWTIYQLWLFVAAGLYPAERKMVTRYIPLSIMLFLTGLVFVYMIVLPLSVTFFLDFSDAIPLPAMATSAKIATTQPLPKIMEVSGDPLVPQEGDLWFNTAESRLKFFFNNKTRVITFGPENLASPTLMVDEYIDLATTFMLVFGVSFQLPLVILALVSVGLVEIDFLRKKRRLVYFVLTIIAAVIAPGDIVTSMMALLVPLILLYEMGIWLAMWSGRKRAMAAS